MIIMLYSSLKNVLNEFNNDDLSVLTAEIDALINLHIFKIWMNFHNEFSILDIQTQVK